MRDHDVGVLQEFRSQIELKSPMLFRLHFLWLENGSAQLFSVFIEHDQDRRFNHSEIFRHGGGAECRTLVTPPASYRKLSPLLQLAADNPHTTHAYQLPEISE